MKKPFLSFLSIIISVTPISAWSIKFAGIEIEETFSVDEMTTLRLNGYGEQTVLSSRMLVAKLFLKELSDNAEYIIEANDPMAIEFNITSRFINKHLMIKGMNKRFKDATNGNIDAIEKEVNQFLEVFDNGVNKGDKFSILYIPEIGTEIRKNDSFVKAIPGLLFKKAFFNMWLGIKASETQLKKALLGIKGSD